jgi:hypothetical protein
MRSADLTCVAPCECTIATPGRFWATPRYQTFRDNLAAAYRAADAEGAAGIILHWNGTSWSIS